MKLTFDREQFAAAFAIAQGVGPQRGALSPSCRTSSSKRPRTGASSWPRTSRSACASRSTASTSAIPAARSCDPALLASAAGIARQANDARSQRQREQSSRANASRSSSRPKAHRRVSEHRRLSRRDRYHAINAPLLREIIKRTAFATDNESSRYALGGVLMEMSDNHIIAVGTDGRRLAKMEGAPPRRTADTRPVDNPTIVPTRALTLIERAIGDEGEVRSPPVAMTCLSTTTG